MKIVASICKVKGERIALVAVQKSVLDHSVEADRYIQHLKQTFDDAPIVLYGQDAEGKGKFYGRGDLVDKLGEIPPDQIPWQEIEADV